MKFPNQGQSPYQAASLMPLCRCSQRPCLCPNVHRAAGPDLETPTDDLSTERALDVARRAAMGGYLRAYASAQHVLAQWDRTADLIEQSDEYRRLDEEGP